jgi:hypothetical protein
MTDIAENCKLLQHAQNISHTNHISDKTSNYKFKIISSLKDVFQSQWIEARNSENKKMGKFTNLWKLNSIL